MMKLKNSSALVVAVGLGLSAAVHGQVVVPSNGNPFELTVGTHLLLPNTPGQTITLSVENVNTSPHLVSGVNLYMEIDGGAADPGLAPLFTAFDVETGTPFDGEINPPAAPNPTLPSKSLYSSFTVKTTPVPFPVGVSPFITLTIDTVGLFSGNWSLKVSGVNGGSFDTMFLNVGEAIPTTYFNGTIEIVPEPTGFAGLAAFGLVAFAGARRPRR